MRESVAGAEIRSKVPIAVLLLSAGVLVTAAVLLMRGAFLVGVTWDERIHAVMLQEYFTSGWYASPDWLVNGHPDSFLGKWPYYVYAPVAALIGHLFAGLTGSEAWGGFSDSASSYAARHLAAAFMALIGIAASSATVWVVTRSWRWTLLGAGIVSAVPMWIGHGMFNEKDLPVGTGYTLATLGLVLVLTPTYGLSRRGRVASMAPFVAGMVLAVGTRPASGLPIALTALGMAVGLGLVRFLRKPAPSWLQMPGRRSIDLVIGITVSYVLLVAIYPKGFINPLTLVKESLLISGRFPVNDLVLTNGVWLSQPPPWFYLPVWFGFQLPLVVLALVSVFLVHWLFFSIRYLRTRDSQVLRGCLLPIPLILQMFLLPALAIAAHSTIYNGVRQFLFVVPAAGVLAVLGLRSLVGDLMRDGSLWRASRALVWILVAGGILAPVVDSVRLFPYTYVYFNELSAFSGVNGNWPTDYWRASSQEIARMIPPTGRVTCQLPKAGMPLTDCGTEAPYKPFWNVRGTQAEQETLRPGEFWFVRENNGDISTPTGCTQNESLTRYLRGERVVIAQIFRCAPAAH